MKMKVTIHKSRIILAALVLALGAAVYLNWEYMKSDNLVAASCTDTVQSTSGKAEETANYGDAYFVEARLSRTQSRDEAMDALKYMLENASLDSAKQDELTKQAAAIAADIEKEGKIENVIKAKGFEDCMVYLGENKADVIVKSSGLTDSEAAQIMDAVLAEVSVPQNNISIIEIK